MWFVLPAAAGTVLEVPAVFPDVPSAVGVAADGDVIEIAAGEWDANVTIGAAVTIHGAGMGVTTLDGPIVATDSLTLQDLTVTTAKAAQCVNATGLTVHLDRVRMTACGTAGDDGGALFAGSGTAVEVYDSEFEDNLAANGSHISATGPNVELLRSFFHTGTGTVNVGGVSHEGTTGALTVTDCWFGGNVGTDTGGALHTRSSQVHLTRTVFEGNDAYRGGALYSLGSGSMAIDRIVVRENTGARAALDLQLVGSLSITQGWLCGNHGDGDDNGGSALRLDNCGSVSMLGTAFVGNTSDLGTGAMRMVGGTLVLHHVTFLSNGGTTGGLGMTGGATGTVAESLFAHSSGSGLTIDDPGSGTGYDGFYDNSAGDSIVAQPATVLGPDVIGADPGLLVDSADCDLVDIGLQAGSTLIDAGDPAGARDTDASLPDIGASGGILPLCPLGWYYRDADHDGLGDAGFATRACDLPGGFVADATDCDDTDPAVLGPTAPAEDLDGDYHGGGTYGTPVCGAAILPVDDCDDSDATRHPGAVEVLCNGIDEDCSGADDCGGTTYTTGTTDPIDTTASTGPTGSTGTTGPTGTGPTGSTTSTGPTTSTTTTPTGSGGDDDDDGDGKYDLGLEGGMCACDGVGAGGLAPAVVAALLLARRRRSQ